ncbi:hypothetical protein QLX08_011239 [Tetragonisca angustula]|uniref:Uncharacterized protein n=1 Tax=Tetragonisca angustula TaxID=166442 RepID=A0AAW0Z8R0_9HYME
MGKIKPLKYDTSTLKFVKDYVYLGMTFTTSGRKCKENVQHGNRSIILNLETHDGHKIGCLECQTKTVQGGSSLNTAVWSRNMGSEPKRDSRKSTK